MKKIILACAFYIFLFAGFVCYVRLQKPPSFLNENYVVVVLTGDKNRIKFAINLAHQINSKYVLISGVHTKTCLNDITKYQLKDVLIDNLNISVGYSAKNTLGNVNESLYWCEKNNFNNIVVTTSDYHMPRVYLEFSKFNKNKNIAFYAVKSENINLIFLYKCFREFNKCLQILIWKFF